MMLSEETSAVRPQKQTRFNGAKLVWMLKGSPLTVTSAVIIVLMLLMMIFSPWLATHDPNAIDLTARLLPPSAAHWFGTDEVGRDLFSRVLVGSQQSILAGLVVVAIAGMIGSLLGCLSGVLGGRADAIIMRIMDIMLSIPSLVLTMALAAALGPSLFNAMLAIAIVRIPFYVRLARGQALVVRQYTYVQAAKTFGASRWHLINWHILRNSLPPLIVQASLDIGSAILMAATLGFIGLGAQQPSAEWGAMVANGRNYVLDQWWYCAFPGAAILLTAVGFNLFGDGIRDLLDPKSGCGKSTLAQLLMGMLQPSHGQYIRSGSQRIMQMVFQDPLSSLNPRLPVWRIITEPLWIAKRSSEQQRRALAEELAVQVGIRPEYLDRLPHAFSGGQRQRIAIARALSSQPDVIVLDEPTSALDISVQAQILNLLVTLQENHGLTYVLISHNVSVIRHMSDRVAVMYLGQIVELGDAQQVLTAPAHPYTRLLLDSLPAIDKPLEEEWALRKTDLPGNRTLPQGCFFYERCPLATHGCEVRQSLAIREDGRELRCWRAL
ncbi:putative D,D-dipeptide transport system permease ddpC domain protein [Escherichia coli 5-366-08_S4_C2]|nr:putative D,D-dipeptide transport system permease ddpC domain protein [Escherichia coli 5-366-08_S4_C2]